LNLKIKVQIFFGYALIFFGIFIFIVGIGMIIDPGETRQKGLSIAVASLVFLIPGFILIMMGRKNRLEQDHLEYIISTVKSYRRIKLVDISQKLGISISQANMLLLKAVSGDMIKGYFDRSTDEFFTDEAQKQKLEYKFCPNCGSPLDKVYLSGETVKCNGCGFLMN
jgi:hypothetical protein